MHIPILIIFFIINALTVFSQNGIVVFQSDFGLKDGAVSAMKGVAAGVSPALKLYDITHEIPNYNVWEASYRLEQTVSYWPAGTVFVSVVDPGVGTSRRSVAVKTKTGHIIVTPDNGTLTHVSASLGIDSVREIDEAVNRLANSEKSYTFHGRDVYAYTGARLAAGVITFSEVGKSADTGIVRIPHQAAQLKNGMLFGTIPVLDVQYGNIWTNIPRDLVMQVWRGRNIDLEIKITHDGRQYFSGSMPLVETFGQVKPGQPLAYFNSLMQLSFAINQASFAAKHRIGSGENWTVEVRTGK